MFTCSLRKSNYWLSPTEIGLSVAQLTHLDNSIENQTIAACIHSVQMESDSVFCACTTFSFAGFHLEERDDVAATPGKTNTMATKKQKTHFWTDEETTVMLRQLNVLKFMDAEDESEPEEEDRSGEDAKEPRDSGCFESSENLESGREEPKTEEELQDGASNQEAENHEQQEENQTEQLDALQEKLQELSVDEGS